MYNDTHGNVLVLIFVLYNLVKGSDIFLFFAPQKAADKQAGVPQIMTQIQYTDSTEK